MLYSVIFDAGCHKQSHRAAVSYDWFLIVVSIGNLPPRLCCSIYCHLATPAGMEQNSI